MVFIFLHIVMHLYLVHDKLLFTNIFIRHEIEQSKLHTCVDFVLIPLFLSARNICNHHM